MADRGVLLSHVATKGLRGFEIGALMSPFLAKTDYDVTTVDRLSTEDLRRKFAAAPEVAPEQITEVDVVAMDGDLLRALGSRKGAGFDYAIASHVIEHVPDVIGFLSDIANLIRVGGRLLLVVPDKRYSFDYLRELSTLGDLIDAWVRKSRLPTPGQVFDYTANAADVDKLAAWSAKLEPSALARYCTPRYALDLSITSHRDRTYADSHCWVFTPVRMLELWADLVGLSLLQWKLVFFDDTRRNEEDFGLVLERIHPDEDANAIVEGFRAAAVKAADDPPDLHSEIVRLRAELECMHSSSSWRLTAPWRWAGRIVSKTARPR